MPVSQGAIMHMVMPHRRRYLDVLHSPCDHFTVNLPVTFQSTPSLRLHYKKGRTFSENTGSTPSSKSYSPWASLVYPLRLSSAKSDTMENQGAAPAYSEAEKGILVSPAAIYPKDEKKGSYIDEKKAIEVSTYPVPEKKDTPAPRPSKPAAKPKKKVSKWILWQLWFNTYR